MYLRCRNASFEREEDEEPLPPTQKRLRRRRRAAHRLARINMRKFQDAEILHGSAKLSTCPSLLPHLPFPFFGCVAGTQGSKKRREGGYTGLKRPSTRGEILKRGNPLLVSRLDSAKFRRRW